MQMDYDIWYKGGIIGNCTGLDKKQALRNARAQFGDLVAVSACKGSQTDADAAKQTSLKLTAAK